MSKYRINIEDKVYEMEVELISENDNTLLAKQNNCNKVENPINNATVGVTDSVCVKENTNNAGFVTAPMPGTVLSIFKNEGDSVKVGDVVLVLEAMKMENEIVAPIDGTICKMNAIPGGTIAGGNLLFEVK